MAALLLLTTVLAAWIPTRRGAGVDPVRALQGRLGPGTPRGTEFDRGGALSLTASPWIHSQAMRAVTGRRAAEIVK